jgi:hypothetical protein
VRGEPLVHSHVGDALPPDHPLAHELVRCDCCDTLLHSRRNSCLRTWLETGRGNLCVGCFVLAAGGLAPDGERGLGGVDCLTPDFGLRQNAPA